MSEELGCLTLQNFFIFNSKFGQKEGEEHEKLLFYYPEEEDIDTKIRNIGLAEAITRFTSTFNKEEDCESLHTQQKHQIYFQSEPNIWIIMTVALGWTQRQKESTMIREYLNEDYRDQIGMAHIKQAYKSFALLHDSFNSILSSNEPVQFRSIIEAFFNQYLKCVDFSRGSIMSIWDGISFLPLDRQGFLRVHGALTVLQSTFPSIVHSAFFYKNSVVWCGFSMEDLQVLSKHIQRHLSSLEVSLESLNISQSSQTSSGSLSFQKKTLSQPKEELLSRFIGEGSTPFEIVYICDKKGIRKAHRLVIYSLGNIVICMAFPALEMFSSLMFSKIVRILHTRLSNLETEIENQLSSKSGTDGYRYLYHNRMNLATKMSSVDGCIPPEAMQTITDMHLDLEREKCSELVVKTSLDRWIVGKVSNKRESYVVVTDKKANLVEVTDEVTKFCNSHFSNIFMID